VARFFAEQQYGSYVEFLFEGGAFNVIEFDDGWNKMKLYREGYESDSAAIELTETELKLFEGVYSFSPGNEMKVFVQNGKLRAVLPGQPTYTLLPLTKEEFIIQNLHGFKMIFKMNDGGEVISVTSSQPNGDFTAPKISNEAIPPEKENPISITADELKKYEGDYEFAPGNEMKIYIKEGKLKAFLPGQPEYTLVPVGKNEFSLENLDGFKLVFEVNDSEEVFSVTAVQPNGSFKGKRVEQ
jgi:hypothetical protein